MSMTGELNIFLGLQIKQAKEHVYIHHTKYAKELLTKFNLEDAKEIKTPMHLNTFLGLKKESKLVNHIKYSQII